MDTQTRRALEAIRLDWATTPDDVWGPQAPLHVPGLHDSIVDEILRAFGDAARSTSASPLGVAVRGPAGSGKTHLFGQVREQVHSRGGYFFLVKLLDGEDFWRSILVGLLEDLSRPTPTHRSQLTQLLDRLGREAGLPDEIIAAVSGEAELSPDHLDQFIRGVYTRHSRHRRRSQHILRALVLTESDDFAVKDLGESFLHLDIDDAEDLSAWGIRNARLGYQEIVENISRIIAFDNAAVLAIDQIDTLIEAAKSERREDENSVEKVAHGLMSVRETMSRTVAVVSCITAAWEYLESHVMRSVVDRFRQPPILQRPTTVEFGRTLLAKRFAPCFAEAGFSPPYATWPVTEEALAEGRDYTPRELMRAVDRHIAASVRSDTFTEMRSLGRTSVTDNGRASEDNPELAQLDRRFEQLKSTADITAATSAEQEDTVVPPLLHAGLASWIEALPEDGDRFQQDPKPSPKANLHGTLRRIVDLETDSEQSWSFRAIAATHYRSVQSRLANATTAAGLSLGGKRRTLIVLRRTPWPSGAKTTQMVDEMHARGGHVVAWSDDDIRTLMALRQLRSERSEFLSEWIALRNPAGQIAFLRDIVAPSLATEPMTGPGEDGRHAAPEPALLPPLATQPLTVPEP
ncbi:ATP-binding protein, partial [Gordonia sp. OPL2]|uniref:ATP-binding protein n=1 Tax=Gordonia sp. OPL2 TaxID=2486274 RepID=UPI00165545B4